MPALPLFLIGFMGAGKSTFAKPVADTLGWKFKDLDSYIEEREEMRIPDIFTEKGEDAFRKIEKEALIEMVFSPNVPELISCGGGTPCYEDNMEWMNQVGSTLYLREDPSVLFKRLKGMQKGRPMIRDISPEKLQKHIKELLARREYFYLQADFILEGEYITVEKIVEIAKSLSK